jgi:hypothetical protein
MRTRTKVILWVLGGGVLLSVLLLYLSIGSMKYATMPGGMHGLVPDNPFIESAQKLKSLLFGNIAYNTPRTMKRDDTEYIELVLGLDTPIEELKKMIEASGEKHGTQIQVSNRMGAQLTGPDFSITEITPETQVVAQGMVTKWRWEVKPKTAGRHKLHVAIWAILIIEGQSTPSAIHTYDRDIDVYVPWPTQLAEFFKANWQWLWGALLVPLAGWLWQRKKGAKTSAG